ncbi:YchJ family protein [Alkalimonas mucilaginosa]|uniref:YchJ family metal-binding protein n=1 Tax=Alkalimonas mucilaginosa TaxID=3057676 RepID=A0ABU7JHN7_9GAMM|nr:YchJ family metal-binding protein [Alkalimonas sp. MEB004]MEE2025177.1 YchJ family metal-binding protein [Alkalimonas sp. MEB004]
MHCYCGSGLPFSACCQPYLSNQQQPENCEQLMRSRYSAFCLQHLTYLHQTCSHELQAEQAPEQMREFVAQVHFTRLQILPLPAMASIEDEGHVHFQVWYLQGNQLHSFRELSRFSRQQGRWLYQSGTLAELPAQKVGRNDPCPCGSGRKFKSCQPHLLSAQAAA